MKKKYIKIILSLIAVVFIVFSVSFYTMAVSNNFTIKLDSNNGGDCVFSKSNFLDPDRYIVSATNDYGYKFKCWYVKGKYILNKGNLNDDEIDVTLTDNCEFFAVFDTTAEDAKVMKTSTKHPINKVKSNLIVQRDSDKTATFIAMLCIITAILLTISFLKHYLKIYIRYRKIKKKKQRKEKAV